MVSRIVCTEFRLQSHLQGGGISGNKCSVLRLLHLSQRAQTLFSKKLFVTTNHCLEFSSTAKEDFNDIIIKENFFNEEEEASLLNEVNKSFRRTRYEYSHWDGAITGFRETEKSHWKEMLSHSVIERLQEITRTSVTNNDLSLPLVHVLDLAHDGFIRPHIDSVKFCGNALGGISLLSTSVMRLCHQNDPDRWILALLPRYSLYIIKGVVRYNYTHEILPDKESYFKNQYIPRTRRISIISRTQTNTSTTSIE